MTTPGKRVEYSGSGAIPERGAFWNRDGSWWGVTPNGLYANLRNHTVVEHEDKTITVSPSIAVNHPPRRAGQPSWHGFLERGVWREA